MDRLTAIASPAAVRGRIAHVALESGCSEVTAHITLVLLASTFCDVMSRRAVEATVSFAIEALIVTLRSIALAIIGAI